MKKKISKQEVVTICIQKQEEQVENFDNRVTSMKSDINNKDNSASQSEDRQAGNVELLSVYEKELAFSATDLNYLKSLTTIAENSTVQPGALVITNETVFFIGISTEKFEINGETVIGYLCQGAHLSSYAGAG